jgi:hypothetical protein
MRRTTLLRCCCRRWSTGDDKYDSRLDGGSDSGRMNRAKVRFAIAMTMAITKSVIVLVPVEPCNMRPFNYGSPSAKDIINESMSMDLPTVQKPFQC